MPTKEKYSKTILDFTAAEWVCVGRHYDEPAGFEDAFDSKGELIRHVYTNHKAKFDNINAMFYFKKELKKQEHVSETMESEWLTLIDDPMNNAEYVYFFSLIINLI